MLQSFFFEAAKNHYYWMHNRTVKISHKIYDLFSADGLRVVPRFPEKKNSKRRNAKVCEPNYYENRMGIWSEGRKNHMLIQYCATFSNVERNRHKNLGFGLGILRLLEVMKTLLLSIPKFN
jgi:hypothetical protein